MSQPKRPVWPSDDQVRELDGDREFTDDGRKLNSAERVGGVAPDTDPDHRPSRPRRRAPR